MARREGGSLSMGGKRAFCLGVLAAALIASTATAQVDLQRFERRLEQIRRETETVDQNIPAEQRTYYDAGAYFQFNFLVIDDTDQKTHVLRQTNGVVYANVNLDNVHQFFVRVRSTYSDFNSGDSFNGSGDDWVEPTLDRATYRLDVGRAMSVYDGQSPSVGLVVQGGRQLVHWANGLALSEQLDGGLVTLSHKNIDLQLLVGLTRDSVADFDSSRPTFTSETSRLFYGAMLAAQATPNHRPYLYGLVQEDRNDDDVLLFGATTTRFNYDSFYVGVGSTGSLTQSLQYGVEAVYQGGEGLSSSFHPVTFAPVSQTEEDISAWALDVTLDYLVGDAHQTRLSGELLLASADDDRLSASDTFGGNQSGTTDGGYNGFGLINTGLAFNPQVSNLFMLRAGASTYPLPQHEWFSRLQVGADVFWYHKLDSNAPINETTRSDGQLGFETDVFVTWQATSDLAISLRYGVFFPGDAIAADSDPRHFLFTGVTLGF